MTTAPRDALPREHEQILASADGIIGYAEMLIEEAESTGPADFLPYLRMTRDAAGQALNLLRRGLATGGRGQPASVIVAGMEEPLEQVASLCEMLTDSASARGLSTMHADLTKIKDAVARILAPEPPPAHVADPAQQSAPAAAEPRRSRVLVTDDLEANRDLLARHLRRQGMEVALAENGRLAIEQMRTAPPDLLLLDIMMPEMDGYQVLQAMKEDAELREIPVIVISALDAIESIVTCIELGAEDYLPKPFDPVLLRARVGASLEKKHLRDQELEYLRQVRTLTGAAAAVEGGAFDPATLDAVAARPDELGRLAAMFQRMARGVKAREQRLEQKVASLTIQIDETRKERAVAEITESDYFQQLQSRARELRGRASSTG